MLGFVICYYTLKFCILCRGGGTSASGSTSGDELKTQFMTREGTYRLMTLSEYSRPNRVGYANNAQGGTGGGVPVRVSFVTVPAPEGMTTFDNRNSITSVLFEDNYIVANLCSLNSEIQFVLQDLIPQTEMVHSQNLVAIT